MLCCGYTLTDFPISIRLTSLALWQSNDCPSASKATLMNMDKYFMWIHNKWLHNHNKAKHNKTVCIFLGTYCTCMTAWHHWVEDCPFNVKKVSTTSFMIGIPPVTWIRIATCYLISLPASLVPTHNNFLSDMSYRISGELNNYTANTNEEWCYLQSKHLKNILNAKNARVWLYQQH